MNDLEAINQTLVEQTKAIIDLGKTLHSFTEKKDTGIAAAFFFGLLLGLVPTMILLWLN